MCPCIAPLPTGLFAALWLAAPSLAPTELAYSPEEGSVWEKSLEVKTEMTFDDLAVVMDGRDVDKSFLPVIDMEMLDTLRVRLTDEVRSVGEGRPQLLHRTYEELSREGEHSMEIPGMMPAQTSEVSGSSPLEGRTIAFAYDEDGDVECRAVDDESGELSFSDLEDDFDFLAWLPDSDVEQGDSWDVPIDVLGEWLDGGDAFGIELEGDGVEEFTQGEGAERDLDGELTLRLAALREDDGAQLAHIEIRAEFTTETSYAGDLSNVPVADGTATVTDTTEYEMEGELVWDLAAGVARSFETSSDFLLESVTVKDPGQDGPEYESTATLSGTLAVLFEVERAE